MRLIKLFLLCVVLTSFGINFAEAHDRFRVGVSIGVPLVGPAYPYGYYYPPSYYYPPVVSVPAAQPVYVEQAPVQQRSNNWYYCPEKKGYYPYVKECLGGWAMVAPTPPDAPQ